MKQKVMHRTLSAVLAASMMTAMTVPAMASGNETYKAKDNTLHSLRWADGIVGSQMDTEDKKGNMVPEKVTVEGETFEVLITKQTGNQGWYDLNQEPRKDPDQDPEQETKPDGEPEEEKLILDSGYLAAAANLTYWWLMQNSENMGQYLASSPKQHNKLADVDKLYDLQIAPASGLAAESPVYSLYLDVFPREAHPDQLLDFFLNGYTPKEDKINTENHYKPHEKGGFFFPVLNKKLLTNREEATVENMNKALAMNEGVILELRKGDSLRYMNLWGMETNDAGELTALFVTDSLDELSALVRYEVTKGSPISIAGMEVSGLYCVTLGEVLWTDYLDALDPAEPQKPEMKPEETEKPSVPEKNPEPETKPQIQWNAPVYVWSKDNKICKATRTAKGSKQTEEEESIAVAAETKAPTDQKPGVMTYTAEFDAEWAETQVKSVDIPQKEIVWNAPTYHWDESMKLCTAERTARDDHSMKETAIAAVTSRESRAPTCNAMGQTTYTAVFEEDWAKTTEKVLENIPKLEPIWNATTYQWSQDHKTCTAVRVCKNEEDGSHVQKAQGVVTHEQTKKPTSTAMGETTYTARFNVNWAETQKETVSDVPKLNPSWKAPVYTWSEDYKTCIAVREDKNDPNRRETATAKVTAKVTKEPTCKSQGETTYVAEFKEEWAVSQKKSVMDIPQLKPDWGKPTYQWSKDHRSCTAVRVCKNDKDHIETAAAKVTSERTEEPTLTEKGETTYRAVFDVDWAEDQKAVVRDIPEIQNYWNPTTYEWTETYQQCVATRVNQMDKNLVETAFGVVTSRKTKAPTNNMKGETTYTATFDVSWANTQKKVVANIPMIPGNPNGNPQPTQPPQWKATTYEWSEDFSRCTASRSRIGDSSNADLTWGTVTKKEVKAPTCAAPGEAVYTAKFKEPWAKDQTIKGQIPALDHKLQKVEAVAATAGRDGVREHYQCTECKKLFLDAKGEQQVTRDQLKLSGPSVSGDYAILNGVPEKDNLVAISVDKFTETMKENPSSAGVFIPVGNFSVTYDQKDIDAIVKAAGDHKKLQLEIYRTDSTDSGLTPDQIQAADRNPAGVLYLAELSYVKNGKNIPIPDLTGARLTVPYTGTDAVRIYEIGEDGTLNEISGSYQASYVTFAGDNGLYMLTESRPSAEVPQKHESKVGLIIWTSVLVVSGLLTLGLVGFYFYQKKMEVQDAEVSHRFSETDLNPDADEGKLDDTPMDPEDSDFLKELGLENLGLEEEIPAETPRKPEEMAETEVKQNPSVPASSEAKPAPKPSRPIVSPVAPKAPMQKKPTIAEKTAEAENHNKNPKA